MTNGKIKCDNIYKTGLVIFLKICEANLVLGILCFLFPHLDPPVLWWSTFQNPISQIFPPTHWNLQGKVRAHYSTEVVMELSWTLLGIVHFIWQFDWGMECPGIWLDIIVGISVRVCVIGLIQTNLYEIDMGIRRLKQIFLPKVVGPHLI